MLPFPYACWVVILPLPKRMFSTAYYVASAFRIVSTKAGAAALSHVHVSAPRPALTGEPDCEPRDRPSPRQRDVLAACVEAGGSFSDAARLVGIRPSTAKRHLADLRAKSGLTTEQLIYSGRAEGWLVVPSLEPGQQIRTAPQPRGRYGGVTSTRPA